MKKLNFLSNLCSSSRADRVRTLAIDAVSLPSFCRVNMLKLVSVLAILLTIGVGNAWADYVEFTTASTSLNISGTTYTSNSTGKTIGVTTVKWTDLQESSSGILGFKASTGCIWNTAAMPANIDSIVFTNVSYSGSSPSNLQVYGHATTAKSTANTALYNNSGTGKIKVDFTSKSYKYFYIKRAGSNRVAKTSSIRVYYTAASCTNPPTIGTVSANGPFTWNTSFPLSVSSIGAGTGCSISEYGFVWKSGGSEPTISDNKTKIGESSSATSFSGNITGTFATGTTYKVKAYVTNNGGTTTLSSAYTLVARTVTFNMNGHGDAPATQYVANGEKASQPANPSATGWTFGGWYKEAGCSNVWNFASETVSGGNKNIYAKWTAKTTTVSFNQNSGTGGQTSNLTATYGSAMPAISGTPTREGYDFGGYYDGSGGTGTKYYNADGSSATNWDKENSTWTLYAKWTVKSYSVTWKVNNTNYSAGGSTSVNHGSRVATLPTAPDPGDYCGDKFVGWTTDAEYVHNTSPLFTAAGSAPVADGAQIFYAVFADYDE